MTTHCSDIDRRILVIDDSPAIHDDFYKVLTPSPFRSQLADVDCAELDEPEPAEVRPPHILIDGALQGQEGLEKIRRARMARRPFHVVYVDMRMPPGWDGLRTINELWKVDPDLQIVICTAYSDRAWRDIYAEVNRSDQLLILKKPFDNAEVLQLTLALTDKWHAVKRSLHRQDCLERLVAERTARLQRAERSIKRHRELLEIVTSLTNAGQWQLDLNSNDLTWSPAVYEIFGVDPDDFRPTLESVISRHHVVDQARVSSAIEAARRSAERTEYNARVVRPSGEIRDTRTKTICELGADGQPASVFGVTYDVTDAEDTSTTEKLVKPAARSQDPTRQRIEAELKTAIERSEFVLYYQPIVSSVTGRVCGLEALLRWDHPDRGIVPPFEFVPIAEASGLICEIGDWVLQKGCEDAVQWPDDIHVGINVSAIQFLDDAVTQSVKRALYDTGLAPERLELEITETVLLKDSAETLRTLHTLRDLGVGIVLDDFGIGYSSLSYLRSFPFDRLKLDKSFVLDASSDKDGDAIIKAVADLGKSLGMMTTAEGVEAKDQLERVTAAGFTHIQGFYYSKPRPISALLDSFGGTNTHFDFVAAVAGGSTQCDMMAI